LLAVFLYLLCSSFSGTRKWQLLLDHKDLSLCACTFLLMLHFLLFIILNIFNSCSYYSSFCFITILLHHSFSFFCISFPFSPSVSFGKLLCFYCFTCSSSFSFFFTISSLHILPHLLPSLGNSVKTYIAFTWLHIGCCEKGNEPSDFTKGRVYVN
jgi:hypothetical protein